MPQIIDSHIHLWPLSTSNEAGHTWMTPDNPLSKPHLLNDYQAATTSDSTTKTSNSSSTSSKTQQILSGAIYIETDVAYNPPSISEETSTKAIEETLSTWAAGPLEEVAFLRDLISNQNRASQQHNDVPRLLALVPWAPMLFPSPVLHKFLDLAEIAAGGKETWGLVRGLRFLLQAIQSREEFEERVVRSEAFKANLRLLGRRGYLFEVGVDARSGGLWQLEGIARVMRELGHESHVPPEEKIGFVVNHLCKPDLACQGQGAEFERWCAAVESMADCGTRCYMKLSGAFSELPEVVSSERRSPTAAEIAELLRPWLRVVFRSFGPRRVMFGSDWPVCNVRGPAKERSWGLWREVVELALALEDPTYGLNEEDKEWVWSKTAIEAYRLEQ